MESKRTVSFSEIEHTLVLTEDSSEEEYKKLYSLEKGGIFKVLTNYETVMRRIEEYKPQGLRFEVFPINPGTSLYTCYGPDHCIVVDRQTT